MTGETGRRVLITGGYGYVGGRVAQALTRTGTYAVSLGTRSTPAGAPSWLPAALTVTLEWSSTEMLRRACAGADSIVHLAAMNGIESARDPVRALEVNGLQSLRLLEAAISENVKRFIYLSTAHVYGAPLVGMIDERTLPRPARPYAITHKTAEDFVLGAADAGRIEAIVLRLSNGFGAAAHAGVDGWMLLVNDLCRQAVTERALTLASPGLQRRDFVTLEDVGRAVEHALALPVGQGGGLLFNLGGDAALRVIDMAELIAVRCDAVLGFRPPIKRPLPRDGERSKELHYSSAKFQGTGFRLTKNHAAEIDSTLRLCVKAFGGMPA